jgi:hypothetical protein
MNAEAVEPHEGPYLTGKAWTEANDIIRCCHKEETKNCDQHRLSYHMLYDRAEECEHGIYAKPLHPSWMHSTVPSYTTKSWGRGRAVPNGQARNSVEKEENTRVMHAAQCLCGRAKLAK